MRRSAGSAERGWIGLASVAAGCFTFACLPNGPGPPNRRAPSGDVKNSGWTGSEDLADLASLLIHGDDTDLGGCGRGFLGLDGRQTEAVEDLPDRKRIRDVGNDAEFTPTAATEEGIDAVDLVDQTLPAWCAPLAFRGSLFVLPLRLLGARVRLA